MLSMLLGKPKPKPRAKPRGSALLGGCCPMCSGSGLMGGMKPGARKAKGSALLGGSYISEFAAWKKAQPAGSLPRSLKSQHQRFKESGIYQPSAAPYVPRPRVAKPRSVSALKKEAEAAQRKLVRAEFKKYKDYAKSTNICHAKRSQLKDIETIEAVRRALQQAEDASFE